MTDRDRLFAEVAQSDGFEFDESVAAVFPDMIRRSVPGYPMIIGMIQLLAARYAQTDSRLYDLGCSLGASTAALALGAGHRHCEVIGIDNSPAMLAKAQETLAEQFPQIEWRCGDVREIDLSNASVVVMNFTLQFLPVDDRVVLLRRIFRSLRPGGVLVLSEKIAGDDAAADAFLTELHHAFKRANGYSELEISRKRSALEHVLVTEKLACHRQRLGEAGFSRVDIWFQCMNFASMVAFR